MRSNTSARIEGFSLIELMVGMAVGLIMLGAVIALTVSMLRTNGETITVAKLTQEGRAVGDLISRELRRARYSGNYLRFVGSGSTVPNQFGSVDILNGGNCVRFAYDADDDGNLGANEVKVISVTGGAAYFAQYASYAAADCSITSALRISSPDVQISSLVFARDTGADPNPNRIDVTFRLALVGNTAITRRFDQVVQVRNPFL